MKKILIILAGIWVGLYLHSPAVFGNTVQEQHTRSLTVYPNPTHGKFRLKLEYSGADKVIVKLYDITGKLVQDISGDLVKGETDVSADVDLNNPPAGIYFLRIEIGNRLLTKKIIVR